MSRYQHVKSINSDSSLGKNQSMNKMVPLMNPKRRGIELYVFQMFFSELSHKKKKIRRDVEDETSYIFFVLAQTALHKTRKQILIHCLKIPRKYSKSFLKNNGGDFPGSAVVRVHLPMQEVWVGSHASWPKGQTINNRSNTAKDSIDF